MAHLTRALLLLLKFLPFFPVRKEHRMQNFLILLFSSLANWTKGTIF
jgi:hypothetical protein